MRGRKNWEKASLYGAPSEQLKGKIDKKNARKDAIRRRVQKEPQALKKLSAQR